MEFRSRTENSCLSKFFYVTLSVVPFQKLSDSDSHHFDPLVSGTTRDAPTISLPWMDFEAAIVNSEDESDAEDSPSTRSNQLQNKKADYIPDYSHLYIYKRDIIVSEKEDSFIALGSGDSDSSPEPTNHIVSSHKRKKVKQDHAQTAKRIQTGKHKRRAQEYAVANIVQVHSNINKQKKGKKKK